MKDCNCISEIDSKMREQNMQLSGIAWVMPGFDAVPTIATEWIDKAKAPKGKKRTPPPMMASHCPFCGKPIKVKP